MDDPLTFGDLLRRYRQKAGLSQEVLAEQAGLSPRGISALESGTHTAPHRDTVRLLGRALHLGADDRARLEAAVTRRRGPRSDPGGAVELDIAPLPVPLTSLIGRDQEVASLRSLVGRQAIRLITLTGIGGVGKTRLALQVAAEVDGLFADGVAWVSMAPLASADLVPAAIAKALGLREERIPLSETLIQALGQRSLLLVLDNFEHVLKAVPFLADILASCRSVKALVTSRESLGIPGERRFAVPPLGLPNSTWTAAEDVRRSAVVQLFLERAQAVQPDFQLTDVNAPTVAAICVHLDGLPLAIELAAARVASLSVGQIASRLNDRFRLLRTASPVAPHRQQTLQATVDWSYDLLDDVERRVFERLSVFAGGCGLDAAEAVCAGDGIEAAAIVDVLGHLVSKSLVVADLQQEEVRYRLFETLQQHGALRLRQTDDDATTRIRQRDWALRLVELAGQQLWGAEQMRGWERLETERDNVRVALQFSLNRGDVEDGLRLAGGLWWFWFVRGPYSEGRTWFDRLLAIAGGTPAARCRALYGAALLAWIQGDHRRGRELAEESLPLARAHGDLLGVAISSIVCGLVAESEGDYGRAAVLCEEGLAYGGQARHAWAVATANLALGRIRLAQGDTGRATTLFQTSLEEMSALQERRGVAFALKGLGLAAYAEGEDSRAQALLEQSLALFRTVHDPRGVAWCLYVLAFLAERGGAHDRATTLCYESLALTQGEGHKQGHARALGVLAYLVGAEGDFPRAAALQRDCLALLEEIRALGDLCSALEGMARIWTAQERHEPAAQLFGAAAALRDRLGSPVPIVDRAGNDLMLTRLRRRLGDAAFSAARHTGWTMSPEQATAMALSDHLSDTRE